ncbi:hypothetical protein [Amycolatopsis sp. cmx-8-4]|uniref:hypothetical protein n=1 Tax=Amycolatopsis sp. cmx-8-4 TaxID=2790947 RepID=UPI00397AA229
MAAWTYSGVAQAFVLVLGALWFALPPISVLALVFGVYPGARTTPAPRCSRHRRCTTPGRRSPPSTPSRGR